MKAKRGLSRLRARQSTEGEVLRTSPGKISQPSNGIGITSLCKRVLDFDAVFLATTTGKIGQKTGVLFALCTDRKKRNWARGMKRENLIKGETLNKWREKKTGTHFKAGEMGWIKRKDLSRKTGDAN